MRTEKSKVSETKRKGRGRPPGALNKVTRDMRAAAAAAGELPHEFLCRVSRGELIKMPGKKAHRPTFEERMTAAEKASPYYAPRLNAIAAKVNTPGNPWVEIFALIDGQDLGLPSRKPN